MKTCCSEKRDRQQQSRQIRSEKGHTRRSISIVRVHAHVTRRSSSGFRAYNFASLFCAIEISLFRTREKSVRVTNNGTSKRKGPREKKREIGASHNKLLPIYLLAHLLLGSLAYIPTTREILRRLVGSTKPIVMHPQQPRIVVSLNNNWVITCRACGIGQKCIPENASALSLRTYKVICATSIIA